MTVLKTLARAGQIARGHLHPAEFGLCDLFFMLRASYSYPVSRGGHGAVGGAGFRA